MWQAKICSLAALVVLVCQLINSPAKVENHAALVKAGFLADGLLIFAEVNIVMPGL